MRIHVPVNALEFLSVECWPVLTKLRHVTELELSLVLALANGLTRKLCSQL